MFITIIFIFPLISNQNQLKLDQTYKLPLYKENIIDVIDESGFIYKYHISNNNKEITYQTYCSVQPQRLDIEIESQLKVTHKTEQDFELNFVNGKFYGQSEFIQSAVINSYGIIILTSDKNLTFISHDNINQNIAQTQHFQINESIENSYLIQIESLNLLILLLQDNKVYEYEVHNNTYYNKSIQYISQYKQETLHVNQIKLINVYSTYVFILYKDGNLRIYNRKMEPIYKFESQILHFEFETISQQFRIYLLYQNSTLMSKTITFENTINVNDNQQQILITKPQAVNFKLYNRGILVVVEDNSQGHIIIDYSFNSINLKELNMQYINQKVKHIIIHDLYALLIGDKTQSIITVGVDAIYLNQQNYKVQANLLVPQILNVLMLSQVTNSGTTDYVYAYTRTRFLKLNLLAVCIYLKVKRMFEVFCSCQSQNEAMQSPFHFELEYYNSDCDGCSKKKSYTLFFNYAIMTKEDEALLYESIIIGGLIVVGIIGFVVYKYFAFLRFWKEAQNKAIQLETTTTQPHIEFSINDSKVGFQLEIENHKKDVE
ncbi:unnamed protein product (macronuclear) [Paramecium tetraurelia]|uniref:Transmembrane protein n=1 Tax=Paramecium tetraurelia TaxID=5888 RepID=A0ED79_PARTE|nr:uncharacterized protein GSPATT00004115001 [Paramecium tetraurelia]CAK93246.1 unnamed protein product [Paramecium tetraurelia]|eukprot:XP_001460643.1 hypothetical protein (macronuclear) [Paramecium tetraurelia strain d4-2]